MKRFVERSSRTSTVLIVGVAEIEYRGRAASYAAPAPRLVVLKPDGTLLVHENVKREPLNWQPPGAVHSYSCEEGFVIRSVRRSPREEVRIVLRGVELVAACRLASTELHVYGREEDLARLVAQNPRVVEPGAVVVGREIRTPFGKIDVLLRAPDGRLLVIEVKNERATVASVAQLKRYVEYYRERGIDAVGVLVAPGVSEEGRRLLMKEGFRFVDSSSFTSAKTRSLESYITR